MKWNGMEATRVDFEHESAWSEVRLSDGTVVKVRIEVGGALRLVDRWDDNGDPIYQFNTAPRIAFVSVPENLTKPKVEPQNVIPLPAIAKGKAN